MEIIIRKPRLKDSDNDGIPKDFLQVMEYFNQGLKEKSLPFVSRKTPITKEEILKLWLPNAKDNITLVAELKGKVISQITYFADEKSTSYEYAHSRNPGDIAMTKNPSLSKSNQIIVTELLYKKMIEKLKTKNIQGATTVPIENPTNKILSKLNLPFKEISDQEQYMKIGLSGNVKRYFIN